MIEKNELGVFCAIGTRVTQAYILTLPLMNVLAIKVTLLVTSSLLHPRSFNPKRFERDCVLRSSQGLREDVRALLRGLDILETYLSHLHTFSKNVIPDINVFRSSVRGGVAGEADCRFVIDV